MSNKNEREKADISNNEENKKEKKDICSDLIQNQEDFISLIKKLLNCEFEDLFPKILNLPKIDFLNQLTSNVSFILTEQFSSKIFENEKCMSIISETCRSFDKIYNKYMEELTEGWDQYNFEKMNQMQNPLNEGVESFFLTNFRKHCNKTQNYAVHQCNKKDETGNFIIVNINKDDNKRIKYVICDNCRKSFFINEFYNYCENCKISYLCSTLSKNENENLLPATLNPPHCESFVNEELLCEKCKNTLYIDLKDNKLICGNKNCDYCEAIEDDKKINFECKNCKNTFLSNVKIYNPIELLHFKDIINKALLYKRKAYPGKLSCCKKIKEKKTDFFHKKDCKGKLYFGEYNNKIIIICSKCKAVNQYSKFIWTCPECGIHFRDKKSEENEMKVRKTKSSNKLVKSKQLFPNLEDENLLTLNINKNSYAEILNKRKNKYEKNLLYKSYNNNEDSNIERKINSKVKFLSEKKLCGTDSSIDKNKKRNEYEKKKKRKYIIGKILPFTPRKNSFDIGENNNNDNKTKKSENKKEYYEKKVHDLINNKKILNENDNNKKEEIYHKFLCKSGRINFKYNENTYDIYSNEKERNKEKRKNLYIRNFKGIDNVNNNNNNYDSLNKLENNNYDNNQKTIEINFNKMKSPGNSNRNMKKENSNNDLKCKKFVPIKLKYMNNKENEIENKNNNKENNCENNTNNYLLDSQKNDKSNPLDLKNNNILSSKNLDNRINNNNKESWQSKETTTKGSIESKNSIFSHSPPKDEEEENKKNNRNNNIYISIENKKDINEINIEKEDDIIPFEMIDPNQEIIIEDKKIIADKNSYAHFQRRLKKVLLKGKLPRFDLDKFSIDKQIGDGSFGIIYLVHNNKSKRKYAMKKIIANTINSLELFQKEFEIAYNNPHPSILNIKGVYIKCFDPTTFVLYVLMDLADKDWEVEINERQKNKKDYKEKELISILKQLSSALYFLQKEKNIAHRDIKPENVLIFKNKENKNINGDLLYKLCDFGEAKDYEIIRNNKHKTLRGTELYMSPALYNGLLRDAPYVDHNAFKSDVFSLGCCLIIAANLDFEIINEIRKLKEQTKIETFLKEKLLGKYSEKFIDVILKMINFNEKERIDFIQLEEIIESIF